MFGFHPDTDFKRVALHVPHGLLITLSAIILHWSVGIIGAYWFIKYETNEDLHKKDGAWNDILGALVGFFAVVIGVLILKAIGASKS